MLQHFQREAGDSFPVKARTARHEESRRGPPTWIGVGLLTILTFFIVQGVHAASRAGAQDPRMVVEFSYVDGRASKVSVVGSFNDWSPNAHVMEKDGARWKLEVLLAPGRYEYAFVIDDRVWKLDPASVTNEKNGFGTLNSVLIVE